MANIATLKRRFLRTRFGWWQEKKKLKTQWIRWNKKRRISEAKNKKHNLKPKRDMRRNNFASSKPPTVVQKPNSIELSQTLMAADPKRYVAAKYKPNNVQLNKPMTMTRGLQKRTVQQSSRSPIDYKKIDKFKTPIKTNDELKSGGSKKNINYTVNNNNNKQSSKTIYTWSATAIPKRQSATRLQKKFLPSKSSASKLSKRRVKELEQKRKQILRAIRKTKQNKKKMILQQVKTPIKSRCALYIKKAIIYRKYMRRFLKLKRVTFLVKQKNKRLAKIGIKIRSKLKNKFVPVLLQTKKKRNVLLSVEWKEKRCTSEKTRQLLALKKLIKNCGFLKIEHWLLID